MAEIKAMEKAQVIDRIEQVAVIAGAMAAIYAALLAVPQYTEDLRQAKVNRSYEYSHRYHSGEILNIRLQLMTQFDLIYNESQPKDFDENKLPEMVIKMLGRIKNRPKYDILLEFFGDVYACADLELCNKEATYDLFGKKARDILTFSWPFITHIRCPDNPTYALSLVCLATRDKHPDCKK